MPIVSPLGTAYLFKHTMDALDQVVQVIKLVAERRIIIDPKAMARLIDAEQSVGPIPQFILATDTGAVDSPAMESLIRKDEAVGALGTVQGSLEDVCAVLEQGGSVSTRPGLSLSYVYRIQGFCLHVPARERKKLRCLNREFGEQTTG